MLKRPLLTLVAGAGLLSACGEANGAAPSPGPSSDPAVASAASPAVAGAALLRPGLYRTVQTGDVEIEETRCIDAATIAAGRFLPTDALERGWVVGNNRLAGGRINVSARHPGGGRLQIDGSYRADSFTVDGTLELPIEGELHRVRTQQRGQYLSHDCTNDPDARELD